jgi:hypothetical protein
MDIKQFMFQASGGKDIDANNVEAKAKKIYERALQKLAIKVKTLRMLLMYNLAKEQVGKKQGEKSVGLEVKLPANVMRTLDGDLKTEEEHIAAIVEILNKRIHKICW